MTGTHELTTLLADASLTSGIQMVVYRLALVLVAGLVGALLGGLSLKYAYRAAGKKEVHHPVKVIGRITGGLLAALLMFLWCFSGGGGGLLGGGGGWWPFGAPFGSQGNGQATTKDADKDKDKEKDKVKTDDKKKMDDGPPTVVVHMLGGKHVVKDERWYVLDPQRPPLNFKEVKEIIKAEQSKNRNLKRVEIRVYQDSVASNAREVMQLRDWVREQDLVDVLATLPSDAPIKQ